MSSILKGITINESLQDDFIDLMKSKGYNVKPRGSIEQQKAERDAMLAQRKKDAENRTAPPTPSAEEITNAKEKLAQLERVFDKNYQYSDDHSVYSKNQDIAQQISSLRQLIARGEQGVAEGSDQPVGYIDDEGKLVTIGHKPGFAKSVGHANGGWIDTGRAIPDSWKAVYTKNLEQGVAEGENQEYTVRVVDSANKTYTVKVTAPSEEGAKHKAVVQVRNEYGVRPEGVRIIGQGVAEGFPDDILAMAKKVSPNARIRGSRDEEIARRDAMLAQREKDRMHAPEPKGVSDDERASLEAELQQLMPKYDRHYQMIDNYTQHMQAKHIADRVHEIQRKLKLGVAEGWDPEDDEQWSAEDPKDEMFGAGDAYKRGIQDYRKFMQTKVKPSNPYSYTKQARQADNWEKGFEDGRYKQDVAEGSLNELVDLESAYRRATEITKQIKYDDTVTQIIVQIQMLAEKSGIPEENLRYEIDQVYEAKSQLESAIYGLDEVFQDAMRQQQYDQENNEVDESQIFAGGGMGQSYRKFTPKSAGTMNEMPDTSGPVGTQPGGRRVYRPKSAGTNMKRESSILKGLRETGSTGTSAGSAGIGGGAMVGGPTTYEQEFDPFKRKGARRITAMTNEGKK